MGSGSGRVVVVVVVALGAALGARPTAAADAPDAGTPRPAPRPDDEAATPGSVPPPLGRLPDVHWYTLDTAHFHIHFYEDERALALHTAIIAERAYRLNTRYLNWRPSGRVDLTLNDQTDFANGFASSVPYNFIYGFGAPPADLDELNDFDDYVKLLITHEYTHVVHLDTILGLARVYNFLFGKLYAPNLSQPNWFVEGLAVLMETRQTTGGRLRNAIFDMELRVPFLEGRALGLDGVSNGPLVFPQATAAYLYGSSVLKYVEDRYGPEKIREISHRYGRGVIPGAMNRIAARAVGVGYAGIWSPGIWEDWYRSTSHKFALETDEARRRGLTEERRLTFEAPGPRGDGFTPRFFADGTLVYHRTNNDQAPAYVRLDPVTGKARALAEIHGASTGTPTPDGRGLVFARQNLVPLRWRISGASNLSWNDLYWLDLETGEQRLLTNGRRADEPSVSPDGRQIACTVGLPGTRKLALVPIEGGAPRVLGDDLPGFAYTPSWSPDGALLAYSRWKPGGFRDVHLYDVAAGTDRALAVDRAMDVDPVFSPDGRYVVYSSDRTGIYNVFAYELATKKVFQVTNVVAGAFQPAISPDGTLLVFMGFTSAGYDLFSTPFDPWSWPAAQPFANARPEAPADVASVADSPDALPDEAPVADVVERIRPYEPWKFFYPHSWVLGTISNPLGIGSAARVQFAVGDPAGNHALTFDSVTPSDGDASVSVAYSYNRIWPSFGLAGTRSAALANDLTIDGKAVAYRQHALSGSAFVELPVLREPDSSGDVTFGYTYSVSAPEDPLPVGDPTRGITIAPPRGPDANVFLTWTFSNAHSWAYSISGQEGRSLGLSLQLADPSIGSGYHTTTLSWSWTEYFTPPWARLQALAVLYSGGIVLGDRHGVFRIGGFVDQDVVRALFLNKRQCCTFLRGYNPGALVGDQYHLLSTEYRSPLVWIERGYATFPVYVRRIYGALFVDAGDAFFGQFRVGDLRYGVGAELRAQLNLAYYLESEVKIGVARGLSKGGTDQLYLVTSFPF